MASRKGANLSLEIDMTPLLNGAAKLDDRLDIGVAGVVKRQAQIATGWMKSNAPWTDRTGAARNGLRAETEHIRRTSHSIILMHSVPYGIWLEVRFGGRYAVIVPALVDQGPKLMRTLNKLLSRLGKG